MLLTSGSEDHFQLNQRSRLDPLAGIFLYIQVISHKGENTDSTSYRFGDQGSITAGQLNWSFWNSDSMPIANLLSPLRKTEFSGSLTGFF